MLVTDRHEPRLAARIPDDVPTYVVPHELVDAIVGFPFHRGVLACGETRPWPPLSEIVERAGRRLTLVICPRLSNPENLGAIARIGDVFGVDAILAGPSCPDPFSRRVLRVSMGSILRVPLFFGRAVRRDGRRPGRNVPGSSLVGAVADPAAEPSTAQPGPIESAWFWAKKIRDRTGMAGTVPPDRDDPDAPGPAR